MLVENRLAGLIAVSDTIKAKHRIEANQARFMPQYDQSSWPPGDNEITAARRKGTALMRFGLAFLPQDKHNGVKDLQAKGHIVAWRRVA